MEKNEVFKKFDKEVYRMVFTEFDKQMGFVDSNGNPLNSCLSANDNTAIFNSFVSEWTDFKNKTVNEGVIEDGFYEISLPSVEDYKDFLNLLTETEKVVRYGHKNTSVYKDNIDNLIGEFGNEKLVCYLD